jgi:dihydrolipoamide dehydrogenase
MPTFDVVVVGAGPGGYVAAIRCAQLGLSTAVVEEKYWGGVCLNVGCIPSKALLKNADLAHQVLHRGAEFGVLGDVKFDFGVAWDRSRRVAQTHVKGIHFLMKKNGITEVDGRGAFTSPNTLDVSGPDGSTATLSFKTAIVATGASPRGLPGVEFGERVVTYEQQILSDQLPESIVIVGAGAIGMEFAFILHNYGVRVTILEYLDRVLPTEDAEVSRELARRYRTYGIDVRTSTNVQSIAESPRGVSVTYSDVHGKSESITADKVLVSIGFSPRVEGLGLQAAGIALTDRGAIAIDDHMRTTVPHIYAIGDVTAKLQLAHVAEAQGVVAAETIAGVPTMTLGDYRMMPRATFCTPQVASFGLTEDQARAEGHDVKVVTFPFSANGKANGLGEPTGFVKLVADKTHLELLGGHLVGPDVSELLPELTLAQKWELTAYEGARNVHTHPTLSEAVQEAFHGLAGHMINL